LCGHLRDVSNTLGQHVRRHLISKLISKLGGLMASTLDLRPGVGWNENKRKVSKLFFNFKMAPGTLMRYKHIVEVRLRVKARQRPWWDKHEPISPVITHPMKGVSLNICVIVEASTNLSCIEGGKYAKINKLGWGFR
jgi:hypothetical protein